MPADQIFTGTNADRESIYFPCTADHERDYILNKERSPLMLPLAIRKLHPAQIELTYPWFLWFKSGEDCVAGLQQQWRVIPNFPNFPTFQVWKWTSTDLEVLLQFQSLER